MSFQKLDFVTRQSGTLTAVRRDVASTDDNSAKEANRLVEMRLPLNPATIQIGPDSHADIWALVKTVLVNISDLS